MAKIMFKQVFASRFRLCFPSKQGVKNNPACLWLLASYFRAANLRHGEGNRGVAQGGGRRKSREAGRRSRFPPPPTAKSCARKRGGTNVPAPDAPHREQGKGNFLVHCVVLAFHRFEREGKPKEYRTAHVYHIRDGKLAECWEQPQDPTVFDDAWS